MNMNAFVKANTLGAGANGAMTENGAISYATIGTALLDQFGKAGHTVDVTSRMFGLNKQHCGEKIRRLH